MFIPEHEGDNPPLLRYLDILIHIKIFNILILFSKIYLKCCDEIKMKRLLKYQFIEIIVQSIYFHSNFDIFLQIIFTLMKEFCLLQHVLVQNIMIIRTIQNGAVWLLIRIKKRKGKEKSSFFDLKDVQIEIVGRAMIPFTLIILFSFLLNLSTLCFPFLPSTPINLQNLYAKSMPFQLS